MDKAERRRTVQGEELVEFGKEGTKAIGKLSDLLKQFTLPNVTKRQTNALIYDADKKAEFIRNNPDMNVSFEGNNVNIKQLLPNEIEERAELRLIAKAIRQQENIESIIKHAYNDLKYANECSNEPIDIDWWNHFENCAENISSENMQFLWGKILSGEIKNPGTFSVRTLNDIKSLNKKDAESFQKILPYICSLGKNKSDDLILLNETSSYEKWNITINDFVILDEAGLIQRNTGLTIRITDDKCNLYYGDSFKIVVRFNKSKTSEIDLLLKNVSIPIINITRTGMQLYKILTVENHLEGVCEILNSLRNKNEALDSIRVYKFSESDKAYDCIKEF